jgi:hypothetical protein
MQYLNQNILRPQQQPQNDLFGNLDIKKQPQQQHQVNTTPKSAPNKVIKS